VERGRRLAAEPRWLAEIHKDDAIWELMYFGHARDQ
jgi:hypothetical protein